ncbi:hypothetical protein AB6E04_09470 [Vibrio amylolyticus]|uniref:hypothetical protein n=1 Tax=Vibrio amylolyticus TaxID=2847292 RepID=UPI00354B3FD6
MEWKNLELHCKKKEEATMIMRPATMRPSNKLACLCSAAFLFVYAPICMALINSQNIDKPNIETRLELAYQVNIDDKAVGTMTSITKQNDNGALSIQQTTDITITGFLEDTVIQSTLVEHHLNHGTLERSDNQLVHNGKTFWTQVALSNNEYLAVHSEVTTSEQKEEAEAVELVAGTVAHFIPGAGYAMSLGELLLSDGSNTPKNAKFTQEHFDTSFAALPQYWQRSNHSLPSTVTIFDTESLTLFTAKTKLLGETEFDVKTSAQSTLPEKSTSALSTKIKAQHYTLEPDEAEPIEIWLSESESNVAFFVQVFGHENGDSYHIQLEEMKE